LELALLPLRGSISLVRKRGVVRIAKKRGQQHLHPAKSDGRSTYRALTILTLDLSLDRSKKRFGFGVHAAKACHPLCRACLPHHRLCWCASEHSLIKLEKTGLPYGVLSRSPMLLAKFFAYPSFPPPHVAPCSTRSTPPIPPSPRMYSLRRLRLYFLHRIRDCYIVYMSTTSNLVASPFLLHTRRLVRWGLTTFPLSLTLSLSLVSPTCGNNRVTDRPASAWCLRLPARIVSSCSTSKLDEGIASGPPRRPPPPPPPRGGWLTSSRGQTASGGRGTDLCTWHRWTRRVVASTSRTPLLPS